MKNRRKLSNVVRKNAGITLVALIVTIIVLLILAGVTLSFITGSDGIIGKAERATAQHEQLAEKEVLELTYSEISMGGYLGEEITLEDLVKQIEKNGKNAGVVEDEDDPNTMIVTFDKTNNIYYINMETGKVEFIGTYDGNDNNIELQAGDLKLKSTPSEWTNENVTTTISVNDEIDMTNFVLQYSKDGKDWSVYTNPVESDKTETIYARIKHSMTGQKKLEASTTIANIDKLEPTGILEVTAQTTSSITVKVTADDQAKTSENACSGIKGYYYSSDNGSSWSEITTDTTYTFEKLLQTTDYNLKVKIEDNAGNITEAVANGKTGTVETASSSNITYTTIWNGTNATVTFTTETGYTIETSTDNTTWSEANPITVATGTQIYVRLSDGTNGGTSYSAVKPVLTYTVEYNGNGATSGSTESSTHEYGTAKALTANGFTKSGYAFLGWSTSSTATSATYTDGQSVTNLNSTNGATVNLYAVWEVVPWTQDKTTVTNGSVTLEVGSAVTGYEANGVTGWYVLGAEDGKLLITTNSNVTTVTLGESGNVTECQNDYVTGIEQLNTASENYTNSTYADGNARTIDVDDINRVTGYDPDVAKYNDGTSYPYQWGNEVTYTLTSGIVYYKGTKYPTSSKSSSYSTFTYWTGSAWKTLAGGESATLINDSYYYYPQTLSTISSSVTSVNGSSRAYSLLFANTSNGASSYYWLGSQYVITDGGYAYFGMRLGICGFVNGDYLYSSNGKTHCVSYGLRPVVSLKSNINVASNGTLSL